MQGEGHACRGAHVGVGTPSFHHVVRMEFKGPGLVADVVISSVPDLKMFYKHKNLPRKSHFNAIKVGVCNAVCALKIRPIIKTYRKG